MVKIVYRICIVLCLLFTSMFPFSYSYLNNFGLDEEINNGQDIIQKYYRIEWPGNGSFLIGFLSRYKQDFSEPFERYDLGAEIFHRPWKPSVKSIWNKIGFWYIDNHGGNVIRQFWIGIPSWLPVFFFGAVALVARRRARRLESYKARPAAV